MGTLVNGIKEIFATAKTTGSNVMLCGNDGTPDGHMTMHNLASVLGGLIPSISSNFDANSYANSGIYFVNASSKTNIPQDSWAFFIVKKSKDTGHLMQYWFPDVSNSAYYRRGYVSGSSVTWNTWASFSFDVPTFYKDYNSLASLANALGGVQHQINPNDDFNNLTDVGVLYVCGSGSITTTLLNRPNGLEEAFVLKNPTGTTQILLTTWSGLNIYKRTYDGGWGKWHKLSGTKVDYAQ